MMNSMSMTEREKRSLLLEYIRLAGEKVLKAQEMEKIREELNLSHEEILRLGKEIILPDSTAGSADENQRR